MNNSIKTRFVEFFSKNAPVFSLVLILLLASSTTLGYFYYKSDTELKKTKENLNHSTERVGDLEKQLDRADQENDELSSNLQAEREKVSSLSESVEDATDTIENLEKLRKTDPQLLQKYSKVYFLNENYTPSELTEIPEKNLYTKDREEFIHDDVWSKLRRMLSRAERDGVVMEIVSGYRSFEEQTSLKNNYKVIYGYGANQFSADQGYSEHQLGTAIDVTTEGTAPATLTFESTEAFKWMQGNAHRYGFILSYPKGNKYYEYEPWHWRYVGVELATMLHEDNINFYDLDQREINEYLIKIFD